jgi:aminoglycoside phosphotransferase (APT) family kinase protein
VLHNYENSLHASTVDYACRCVKAHATIDAMAGDVPAELQEIAAAVLPPPAGSRIELRQGQFHDVVLYESVAAIRIARRPAAARELPRRSALLAALHDLGLPFLVPQPLTEVVTVGDRHAVATAWVPGEALPRGSGDAGALRGLLDALADVPLAVVSTLLDEPHAYAGRSGWLALMHDEVIPRLDEALRAEARRRIDAAASLDPVTPALVHGDLGGDNLRWSPAGTLLGVLDWDLAQAFDPAIDAACLAWHGWETVRRAVDATTYERARIWQATFGIEQVGAAMSNGEPAEVVTRYIDSANQWLRSQRG